MQLVLTSVRSRPESPSPKINFFVPGDNGTYSRLPSRGGFGLLVDCWTVMKP
ncbi:MULTISPECIES: hypothetical protein [Cyanophyceae]|uniref:hypothetical protein n=1 Tax=Cyanophyceae TaxID=3028117 RepID=UPI001688F3FE|nr:hypothetical protein [Trichocoleus sp. FACHB-40]MBD2007073.1 hypothetical protein [Trichocoleus sp. FACHB-40]